MGLAVGLAGNGQIGGSGGGGTGNVTDRGAWVASTAYNQHDLVTYNGTGWVVATAHTSGSTFDETKFTEITGWRGAWTATTRYVAGDAVVNANAVYTAVSTFTSGASFVASNWTPVSYTPGTFFLPAGAKIETMPRRDNTGTAATLLSGRLYAVALPDPLKAGVTYNGIAFASASTALSGGNNQWFTLVNASTLATLRSTVDDTSTAWAAQAMKRLALSSTYTPAVDTPVYLGIMINATTVPNLTGKTTNNQNTSTALLPILTGNSTTGLTTPVADGTTITALTAVNTVSYAYVD